VLVVVEIVLYSGLKFGPENFQYRTHYEQFASVISGMYIKNLPAALGMYCLFVSVLSYLTYRLVPLFKPAMNLNMSYMPKPHREDTFAGSFLSANMKGTIKRGTVLIFLILISLSINSLYVVSLFYVDTLGTIVIQILLSAFNYLISDKCFPWFVRYLFNEKKVGKHSSVIIITITTILDMGVPALATMFSDPLCLRYWLFPDETTITYSYDTRHCGKFSSDSNMNSMTCVDFLDASVTQEFIPPFTYSNQCKLPVYTVYFVLKSPGL
jgi:hypothetical protein